MRVLPSMTIASAAWTAIDNTLDMQGSARFDGTSSETDDVDLTGCKARSIDVVSPQNEIQDGEEADDLKNLESGFLWKSDLWGSEEISFEGDSEGLSLRYSQSRDAPSFSSARQVGCHAYGTLVA